LRFFGFVQLPKKATVEKPRDRHFEDLQDIVECALPETVIFV